MNIVCKVSFAVAALITPILSSAFPVAAAVAADSNYGNSRRCVVVARKGANALSVTGTFSSPTNYILTMASGGAKYDGGTGGANFPYEYTPSASPHEGASLNTTAFTSFNFNVGPSSVTNNDFTVVAFNSTQNRYCYATVTGSSPGVLSAPVASFFPSIASTDVITKIALVYAIPAGPFSRTLGNFNIVGVASGDPGTHAFTYSTVATTSSVGHHFYNFEPGLAPAPPPPSL